MDVDMLNLKRAARGDEQAFEALISPHLDVTYRLCLRMMGNEQDAADMTQEALVRAWRSLSTYKAQSRFSTWLYRIASNVCLDELRKRKNRQVCLTCRLFLLYREYALERRLIKHSLPFPSEHPCG